MKLALLTVVLKFFTLGLSSDVDEEYTLPLFPTVKHFVDYVDEDENYLGRDKYSGCACRHSSKKWVLCFGAENCVRFPKNITVEETCLKIRTSSIQVIQVDDLKKFSHLTYLEIEANNKLEQIEPGAFKDLVNIRNLSISYNLNLESFHERAFDGLINLKELVLVKNGINNLHKLAHALSPNFLPKLIKLKLNENQFFHIRKDDLLPMNGSTVEELGLVLCSIEFIEPEALLPLRKLVALRLGENTFNASVITNLMKTLIKHKIAISNLNLYGVGFRKNPPRDLMEILAKSNVTHLNLARNQFEILSKDSFTALPSLKLLDLREVLTLDINADAFSGMPNLETLLLSKNKIPYIPEGVLLPQLTYLDLSSNSGNYLNPSYFSLGKNKFVNMTKLWGLNIGFNNVRVLLNYSFVGLSALEILSLRNASLFQLKNGTFLPLKRLIFLDLENNPFPRINPLTRHTFNGLEKLQVLLLGGCSLNSIDPDENPFEQLVSLKHLGLDRNYIKILSPEIFPPMKKLTKINLSHNDLTSWQQRLFSKNTIEHIQASQNKFTYISKAMLQDFANLTELDVVKNPFTCDCSLYFTILDGNSMMKKNLSLLEIIEDEPPFCVYPDEYNNITIGEYFRMVENNTNLCYYPITNPVIKYSMICVFMGIFALVSFIIVYRYRWYIRYWIFLTKIAIIRKGKILQKSKSQHSKTYEFDAFVSYSNEDRVFVLKMVSMLENYEPFLKLCVYERDFQIGSVISDSVLESVSKSRRTLLVVSNAYIKSQWCNWEAQVAENFRLFFQNENGDLVNDSIVIIKLGHVEKTHMTPMLKYIMKTRVYLQWEREKQKQKQFWDSLRTYLSPPTTNEESDCSP